jgi:hypothetical protein
VSAAATRYEGLWPAEVDALELRVAAAVDLLPSSVSVALLDRILLDFQRVRVAIRTRDAKQVRVLTLDLTVLVAELRGQLAAAATAPSCDCGRGGAL